MEVLLAVIAIVVVGTIVAFLWCRQERKEELRMLGLDRYPRLSGAISPHVPGSDLRGKSKPYRSRSAQSESSGDDGSSFMTGALAGSVLSGGNDGGSGNSCS